jgi:hypothetical protein
MDSPLKKEFEYFLANQQQLAEQHRGKFVVIKDRKIIGVYDNELTAINETKKTYEPGTFLVQKVQPENGYSQTFHSRAVFS